MTEKKAKEIVDFIRKICDSPVHKTNAEKLETIRLTLFVAPSSRQEMAEFTANFNVRSEELLKAIFKDEA